MFTLRQIRRQCHCKMAHGVISRQCGLRQGWLAHFHVRFCGALQLLHPCPKLCHIVIPRRCFRDGGVAASIDCDGYGIINSSSGLIAILNSHTSIAFVAADVRRRDVGLPNCSPQAVLYGATTARAAFSWTTKAQCLYVPFAVIT